MIEGLIGRTHRHRLRVRFAETDQMRIAHHSSYVPWMEEARTEWMRSIGRSYRSMEDAGLSLAVTRLELRYLGSALYDDLLEIETELVSVRKASLDFEYRIRRIAVGDHDAGGETGGGHAAGGDRSDSGAAIAEASTRLALLGTDGRPRRLPADLLSAGGIES